MTMTLRLNEVNLGDLFYKDYKETINRISENPYM